MKKLLLSMGFLFMITCNYAQIQGLSYQAVIISDSPQQIPGYDIENNYLPNHDILVRFSVLDAAGTIDYQEEHATTTDKFGLINLTIGQGTQTTNSPKAFTDMDWNGKPKYLKVDISLDASTAFYTDFSYQLLNFIPYAYHKNITATGSLSVDGKSTVQDLTVMAAANLQSSLDVNNSSPTHLTGELVVDSTTTLDDNLTVNAKGSFKGQVTIDVNADGDQSNYASYPLMVRGSTQGIQIKIDGSKSSENNFLLFADDGGVQGCIEGESAEDVYTDPRFYIENASYIAGVVKATIDVVGASTSSTVCVGLGACVTTPTPSLIISAAAKLVLAIAQLASYNYFRFANAGVVYTTKGADYAEWLPKLNPDEVFYPGEVVGIIGGYVTHNTFGADAVMVVSTNPIVVGNAQTELNESNFVKIAFLGQVPARIMGPFNSGDYVVANGLNDGGGFAVSPQNITAEQLPYIVGMIWPNSDKIPLGFANLAVGLNVTSVAKYYIKQENKIKAQEEEINQLKDQIGIMNNALEQMFPEYAQLIQQNHQSALPLVVDTTISKTDPLPLSNQNLTMIYADINKNQIIEAVALAKKMLIEQKFDVDNDPIFKRLINEPDYLNLFVSEMQQNIQKHIDEDYNKNKKAGINVIKISE